MQGAGTTLTLADGRRLGYEEVGEGSDRAVLFFHGLPGSRALVRAWPDLVDRFGGRVIGVDRPGIGLSDFKPNRTILDWADDIEALADHLGLGRFAILTASVGCVYGLACGYRLRDRVSIIVIAAGLGPVDTPDAMQDVDPEFRRLMTLSMRAPVLLDPLLRAVAFGTRRFPAYTLRRMNKHLPDVDHVVIEELIDADAWTEYASECFRHGTRGARFDFRLVAGPWGFRPEDVDVPVHLWHGEQDVIHPPALARKLAALLPNCDAHFFPDGGAYVGFAHADELADTLVAASRPL